jgi:hypothetical protein
MVRAHRHHLPGQNWHLTHQDTRSKLSIHGLTWMKFGRGLIFDGEREWDVRLMECAATERRRSRITRKMAAVLWVGSRRVPRARCQCKKLETGG